MTTQPSDKVFAGSLPEVYDRYLVPLIFEPYAVDLANRVAATRPNQILEIAAGTGAVTRSLASTLPETVSIIATDLNQGMIDRARVRGTTRPVTWRLADAMQLPFDDGEFDLVVCQFGAMFFPDKGRAFAEARRVLRSGGLFLFNVWDQLEENPFADIVTTTVASRFPADPPAFLRRIPYGYHHPAIILRDIAAGGFSAPAAVETVTLRSQATSHEHPAMGFCQGTPLRGEIEARDAGGLQPATALAADAIAQRFGRGAVEAKMQAHVFAVEK